MYSDEQMIFCLADGAQLLNVKRNVDLDATWRLSPRVVDPCLDAGCSNVTGSADT
jgi:hypothetical protein